MEIKIQLTPLSKQTHMIKRVCVYCASSNQVDPVYFEAAEKLGTLLTDHGVTVVYGGGAVGLMGKLATTVLEKGGHIVGIMPNFMKEVEWQHKGLKELHLVGDMHERKKKFLEETDALVALPGGCGTLEELLEAITLKRLGLYTKPIIILNINQFYDPLLSMLDKCIAEKFMAEIHRNMWTVIFDPVQTIQAIENACPWPAESIRHASLS